MLRAMLLTACCAALIVSGAPTPHAGWSPLDDAQPAAMELDRDRLRRDGAQVEVWIRLRGDRQAVASEFEAAGAAPEDTERVRRTLGRSEHRWSFRCDDASHALAVSTYYDTAGALIREFRVASPAWWPVQPDTVGHRLLREVCGPETRERLADGDASDAEAADRVTADDDREPVRKPGVTTDGPSASPPR